MEALLSLMPCPYENDLMYLVGQLIKKLLYRHFRFIRVVEKVPKIKWDPIVDDKPNTTSPRIKFSQEFTKEN